HGVPEALALHLVVSHLDDEFGSELHERDVLARGEAAALRLARDRGTRLVALDVRVELVDQLDPLRRAERRDAAHVPDPPGVVVEPDEDRADPRAALVD